MRFIGSARSRRARAWSRVALAACSLLAIWGLGTTNGAFAMEETEQLLARMRALPDAALRLKDKGAAAGLTTDALRQHFRGLLLAAPRSVDADADPRMTALLLTVRSRARSAALPLRRHAMVSAVDLDRGTVHVAPALPDDPAKRPVYRPPGAPAAQSAPAPRPSLSAEDQALLDAVGDGDSADLLWLDVGKLLALPAGPGQYLLRIIDFDEVSNAAVMQVRSKAVAGPGVTLAGAQEVATRARAASQAQGLPRFERGPLTPVLGVPGISLALGSPATQGTARRVPLHGALKVKLTAQQIVPRSGAPGAADSPSAIVRATVLVLMKNQSRPMLLPLEIPIWSDHALGSGDVVDAAFVADLSPVLPPQPPAGVYQVYLLSGPYLSGPHALTL